MSKKVFTVVVGDFGVIVALNKGKTVVNKILVTSLNDEAKEKLDKLFKDNKRSPIYILLDNVDQNYKTKLYPPVNGFDLKNLINRDLKKEIGDDKKAIKSYTVTKDKKEKKWRCLMIFTSNSEKINSWIEFLLQLPNRILSIHMMPMESYHLSQLILHSSKNRKELEKRDITFFITHNKVSGTRQIVFYKKTLIFTRIVDYNFDNPKFTEEFEQDIFRTNEYLKRIFHDIQIQDINIVNVLPDNAVKKVNTIKNHELNFINYTPHQAAAKIGFPKTTSQNSNFADILLSNIFVNSKKKILKFSLPRIKISERLYLVIKIFIGINMCLLIAAAASMGKVYMDRKPAEEKLSKTIKKQLAAEKLFKYTKRLAIGDKDIDDSKINDIIDFGKINVVLDKEKVDIHETYKKLELLKKYKAITNSFYYTILNHQSSADDFSNDFKFSIAGKINTKSGDVEELFKQFDGMVLDVKNNFDKYHVKYSELPRDIDFSKKYFTFPFNLDMNRLKAK